MMNAKSILMFVGFIYLTNGDPWKMFCMAATVVSAFLYMLYFNQENMLYLNNQDPNYKTPQQLPAHMKLRNPKERGMEYLDLKIVTSDGCKLHAWLIRAPEAFVDPVTLIFFHANAGNMGLRLPNIEKLNSECGCQVLIVSYRGYGNSTGKPSEEGLCLDADATMNYVYKHHEELKINPKKLFMFGRSLGGAVAAQCAVKHQEYLCGVIFENTFTSISDMVDILFPWLSYPWIKQKMLRMKWDSLGCVKQLRLPLLFLSGKHDEIVPNVQMKRLHDSAENADFKIFYTVENGSHNDTWLQGEDEYWNRFRNFLTDNRCLDRGSKMNLKTDIFEPAPCVEASEQPVETTKEHD